MLSVDVSSTDQSLRFTQVDSVGRSHVIGYSSMPRAGHVAAVFSHRVACPGAQDAALRAEVLESGQALLHLLAPNDDEAYVLVDPPWAVDEAGTSLRTWYEADGPRLRQVVDAREARGAVAFDPSYSTLLCGRFQMNRSAANYINMSGNDSNPFCPSLSVFIASRGYLPAWGYEQYLAPHGKVATNQFGDKCSAPAVSYVPGLLNFEVPCSAHDYCYDLRRSGLGGTVSKLSCDSEFRTLMTTYCEQRHSWWSAVQRLACLDTRDLHYNAVVLLGSTNLEPGWVTVRNRFSGLCIGVQGSVVPGAVIQQESCPTTLVSDRRWQVRPAPSRPGFFELRPTAALGRCARVRPAAFPPRVSVSPCIGGADLAFQIRGHNGQNRYSLRSSQYNGECLRVPNTTLNEDLRSVSCNNAGRERWDIRHW